MRTFHRTWRTLVALALALGLCAVLAPGGVSAHERRALADGKYQAVVGFLNEPAFDNQLNGLDLTVTDLTQKDAQGNGKPVEGLEKTLRAEVSYGGGKTMPLTIQTRFGMPGKYAAYFEPTAAGTYTFHISGDIAGNKIDEKFESGPGRFNDVQSLSAVQFPAQQGAATSDLQARADAADAKANAATGFGLAGMLLGLIGVGLGAWALRRRPVAADTARADAPVVPRTSQGD